MRYIDFCSYIYDNNRSFFRNSTTELEDLEDKLNDKVSDGYYREVDDDFVGKYVKIVRSDKITYRKEGIIGRCGKVERISSGNIGVIIDGMRNDSSSYGVYWFKKNEIKVLDRESEGLAMKNYDKVAIVNILDDYNKKDYGFALYEHESRLLAECELGKTLVVVNPINKDKRTLAVLKDIVPVEEYERTHKIKITAQVVGVVDMDGYNARVDEEKRLKELAEKKAAIEKELEEEINRRKSVEYYEEMAKRYSDNPKLAKLVAELRNLGE